MPAHEDFGKMLETGKHKGKTYVEHLKSAGFGVRIEKERGATRIEFHDINDSSKPLWRAMVSGTKVDDLTVALGKIERSEDKPGMYRPVHRATVTSASGGRIVIRYPTEIPQDEIDHVYTLGKIVHHVIRDMRAK